MFVNHNPYFAFDIKRNTYRCICGNKSLINNKKDLDNGYCYVCALKRRKFIDNIVGRIKLNDITDQMLVLPSENLRIKMMSDRVSYLVDRYFVYKYNGKQPYDDERFVIRCWEDKIDLLFEIKENIEEYVLSLKSLNTITGEKKTAIVNAYNVYYFQLEKMYKDDTCYLEILKESRKKIKKRTK